MTQETQVEFANRLTLKDLGCDPAMILKLNGQKKIALARIYGVASATKIKEDINRGQTYTSFIGHFEGINLQTGEMLQSGKLFLPEGASNTLEHMLNQVHTKKGRTASVDFAFEIRSVLADNDTGYSYETAAILKPEQADPIARVREIVEEAPQPARVEIPPKKTA